MQLLLLQLLLLLLLLLLLQLLQPHLRPAMCISKTAIAARAGAPYISSSSGGGGGGGGGVVHARKSPNLSTPLRADTPAPGRPPAASGEADVGWPEEMNGEDARAHLDD